MIDVRTIVQQYLEANWVETDPAEPIVLQASQIVTATYYEEA